MNEKEIAERIHKYLSDEGIIFDDEEQHVYIDINDENFKMIGEINAPSVEDNFSSNHSRCFTNVELIIESMEGVENKIDVYKIEDEILGILDTEY